MEPITAMKEANSVIGRKGKYKNLTQEQSKKILQDTEDHIFQRDIPEEDFATGGRAGFKGGYLASGAKQLGKKYKGSTLSAILENPKLLGAELGHDGIMEVMRLLPSLFAKGGRAGFAGGSDMGTVADSKGKTGPSKGGYQGGGTGPVERPSGGGGNNNNNDNNNNPPPVSTNNTPPDTTFFDKTSKSGLMSNISPSILARLARIKKGIALQY